MLHDPRKPLPATESQFKKLGKNPKDPQNFHSPDMMLSRGYLFEKENRFSEAIQSYKEYIAKNQNNAWVYAHLADCYRENGYYDLAINNYEKAFEIDNEYGWAYAQRALIYSQTENLDGRFDRSSTRQKNFFRKMNGYLP